MSGFFHTELNPTIVVEPQEESVYKAYDGTGFKVHTLPRDNMGLAYANNQIKQLAGKQWYWLMDDDIAKFGFVRNQRCSRESTKDVLLSVQRCVENNPNTLAMAGLEYRNHAWSAKNPVTYNAGCQVCVAIDGTLTGAFKYDERLILKSDVDFQLQLITAGHRIARFNHHYFEERRSMGTNPGGQYEHYYTKAQTESIKLLRSKWPSFVGVRGRRDDGVVLLDIKWNKLKNKIERDQ